MKSVRKTKSMLCVVMSMFILLTATDYSGNLGHANDMTVCSINNKSHFCVRAEKPFIPVPLTTVRQAAISI